MMRRRPRNTLLSPHTRQFFACCLIIALGQGCTTAEVATPEEPAEKGSMVDAVLMLRKHSQTPAKAPGRLRLASQPLKHRRIIQVPWSSRTTKSRSRIKRRRLLHRLQQCPILSRLPTQTRLLKAKAIPVKMVNLIGAASLIRVDGAGVQWNR